MFKTAPRLLLCPPISFARHARPQRLFSTAPPSQQSRSWKNSATRWGLAIGAVYYYNTSNVFAEEPACPPSSCHSSFLSLTTYHSDSSSHPERRGLHSNPRINRCSPPIKPNFVFPDFLFSDLSQPGIPIPG